MKSIIRVAVVAATFFVPVFASAQITIFICDTTICAVAQNLLYIINSILVPVIFALAFIVFLYGIAKSYIFSGGDPEGVKQGHKILMWGIIAFVVMVSLWGIVNVVANTFGLTGSYAPPTPSSVSPFNW
ncbi:MAG: hypothetical protein Q8L52_01490 [bacterium]|nr:hypothetical protein [bacterium]